jgi:hypothetical protein
MKSYKASKKLTLSTKLNFGKYKTSDTTIYELIKTDPTYIRYIISIWSGEVDTKVQDMVTTFLDIHRSKYLNKIS